MTRMSSFSDKLRSVRLFGQSRWLAAADFDSRSLRLVVVDRIAGKPKISRMASFDLPKALDTTDAAALGEFLGASVRELGASRAALAMSLPRGKAVLKPLSLPAGTSDAEAPAMVRYQVAKELPFRTEEAVVDFVFEETHFDAESPAPEQTASRNVLVAAAGVPVVDFYRQVAWSARLRLERLGLRAAATVRCLRSCVTEHEDKPLAFVHLTADESEIGVLDAGSLAFSRAASIQIPSAESLESDVVRSAVQQAATETIRSLQSYQAVQGGRPVERVLLAGGTGIEAEVARQIGRRLGVGAEVFRASDAIGLGDQSESPTAYVAAIGMAVGDRQGNLSFDFLSPKRPVAKRDPKKTRTTVLGAAAALVLVLAVAAGGMHIHRKQSVVRQLESEVAEKQKTARQAEEMRALVEAREQWASAGQDWLPHLDRVSRAFISPDRAYAADFDGSVVESRRRGRRGARDQLSITSRARDKAEAIRLRERIRSVGYRLGRPGAVAGGEKSGFPDGARVEAYVAPDGELNPAAVSLEPRPADDRWARKHGQVSGAVTEGDAPEDEEGSSEESPPINAVVTGPPPESQDGPPSYQYVGMDRFEKDAAGLDSLSGKPVAFTARPTRLRGAVWALPDVGASDYECLAFAEIGGSNRRAVLVYVKKDSDTTKFLRENRRNRRMYGEGVVVYGRAHHIDKEWRTQRGRSCPVAVIADTVAWKE